MNILTTPETYFKTVKDKTLVKSILSFAGVAALFAIVSTLMTLFGIGTELISAYLGKLLLSMLIMFVMLMILLFVATGLFYIVLRVLGGKGSYVLTFATSVKVAAPLFALFLIPSLIFSKLQEGISAQLQREALMGYTAGTLLAAGVLLVLFVLLLAISIYLIYVHCIGQGMLHKLSTFKTFIAVVLIPLVVVAIFLALLFITTPVTSVA